MILPTMTHTRRFYLSSGTRQRRSLGKKGFPGRGWLCLRSPGPSPSGLHRGLRRMEEEFLAKMQLSRSELAFPGRTLVIKMKKAWSCAMADTRVGEMEGAWGRERPHCLGFRREPPCPLRCWKSQKASRRGSRSAGLGRQDLGARDASPATVCLNTSGCFFRQFLFTVFIDWRGEGSASALPPAGSLSSPAGPRARHCGKLLLLRPRQGKVRRCCQSGRLAPGESEQEVPTGGRTNCQPEGTACQKLGLPRAAETPGQKRDTQQPARESEGQLRTGPHARRQPRRGRCESEPRAAPRRALETFQKALPRASGLSPPEFSPRRGQGDRRHIHCTLGKKRLTWEHGVT